MAKDIGISKDMIHLIAKKDAWLLTASSHVASKEAERKRDTKARAMGAKEEIVEGLELAVQRIKAAFARKGLKPGEIRAVSQAAKQVHEMLRLETDESTSNTLTHIRIEHEREPPPYPIRRSGAGDPAFQDAGLGGAGGGEPCEVSSGSGGAENTQDGLGDEAAADEDAEAPSGVGRVVHVADEGTGQADQLAEVSELLRLPEPMASRWAAERERPDDSDDREPDVAPEGVRGG
jgi:hypothetical protein